MPTWVLKSKGKIADVQKNISRLSMIIACKQANLSTSQRQNVMEKIKVSDCLETVKREHSLTN